MRPPLRLTAPELLPASCPLAISVEDDDDGKVDVKADEVKESKFDNAEEESELAAPAAAATAAAHGVGGDITPPSAEIRFSEPAIQKYLVSTFDDRHFRLLESYMAWD